MTKPPKTDPKASNIIPITVAVIGAVALLLSAAVANWDKIFSGSQSKPIVPSSTANQTAVSFPHTENQSTSGPQSPAVSGVGGNVTMTFGQPDSNRALTGPERIALDGEWQTNTFVSGGSREKLSFNVKTLADGQIIGSIQWLDPDTGSRIFSKYGLADSKTDGHSIRLSFFGGVHGRDSSGDLSIPLAETLYGEFVGAEIQLQYVYPGMPPVEAITRRVAAGGATK